MNTAIRIMFPAQAGFLDRLAIFMTLFLILSIGQNVAAQTKKCECEFSSQEYHAYGTDGACGVFMYDRGRTCEISFAGTGADKEVLTSILDETAWQTTLNVSSQLFDQYLAYGWDSGEGLYFDSAFLGDSIVALARGAIFRKSVLQANLPLKEIDAVFREFTEKNHNRIAETFRGERDPYKIEWERGIRFYIGADYVEMSFQDLATIRSVYFSTQRK